MKTPSITLRTILVRVRIYPNAINLFYKMEISPKSHLAVRYDSKNILEKDFSLQNRTTESKYSSWIALLVTSSGDHKTIALSAASFHLFDTILTMQNRRSCSVCHSGRPPLFVNSPLCSERRREKMRSRASVMTGWECQKWHHDTSLKSSLWIFLLGD